MSKPIITGHHRPEILRVVIDLLMEVHPEGLTPGELEGLILERNLWADLDEVGPRAAYHRVYKTLRGLEDAGLARQDGKSYIVNPEAVRIENERILRDALGPIIKQRLIRSDADQLRAAFDGILEESGGGDPLKGRKVQIGGDFLKSTDRKR